MTVTKTRERSSPPVEKPQPTWSLELVRFVPTPAPTTKPEPELPIVRSTAVRRVLCEVARWLGGESGGTSAAGITNPSVAGAGIGCPYEMIDAA